MIFQTSLKFCYTLPPFPGLSVGERNYNLTSRYVERQYRCTFSRLIACNSNKVNTISNMWVIRDFILIFIYFLSKYFFIRNLNHEGVLVWIIFQNYSYSIYVQKFVHDNCCTLESNEVPTFGINMHCGNFGIGAENHIEKSIWDVWPTCFIGNEQTILHIIKMQLNTKSCTYVLINPKQIFLYSLEVRSTAFKNTVLFFASDLMKYTYR